MSTTWTEPIPIAAFVSEAATFKIHADGRPGHSGDVLLICQPHGSQIGDDDTMGFSLTPAEVQGLKQLLVEIT